MAIGRCDHDPTAPRLRLVVDAIPNQPWFNRQGVERAARLYETPKYFPELTGHAIAGRSMRLRARRSPRREAWALMAAAIIRHTDRRTFRIGDQRDDGLCNGVSIARYQVETGLSRWRICATLREFEAAGYIVTKDQPVEKVRDHAPACERKGCSCPILLDEKGNPRHRGFPAQRLATSLLFTRLGYTAAKIKKARRRGYDDWCKRRAPAASAVAILGGRRAVTKLLRANRARNARLESGSSPAAAPAPAPARIRATPERLDRANQDREERLKALPPPDPGPRTRPPGSR